MASLHHVTLVVPPGSCSDVAGFFLDVFDCTLIDRADDGRGRGLRPGGTWLAIDDDHQLHLSERTGQPHPAAHLALIVDDFAAVRARLDQLGAPWEDAPQMFGGGRGFTTDPVGNRIEVLERAGDLA